MGVAITGLFSNMDTDSIVEAMVSGYKVKKDNYVKAKTKLEWTQDAWKELNTKVYGFYTKKLSPMRFSNAFNKKKATSTSNKATVSASSGAVSGTQTLKIKKLATSGYLTGGVVSKSDPADTSKLAANSKLSELGITDGSSISVTTDKGSTNIELSADMSVNAFVTKLKEAGVNASFDEINQRFFVSAKDSGAKGDFSITANNSAGSNALSRLGLAATTNADLGNYQKLASQSIADMKAAVEAEYDKAKTALYDINDSEAMAKYREELTNKNKAMEEQNKALEEENKTLNYKKAAADTYTSEYAGKSDDEKKTFMSELDKTISELEKKENKTDAENDDLARFKAKKATYEELAAKGADLDISAYKKELSDKVTANTETIDKNKAEITDNQAVLDNNNGEFAARIDKLNADITAKNNELHDNMMAAAENKRMNAMAYIDAYNETAAPTDKITYTTNPADATADADMKNSQAYKDALAAAKTSLAAATGATGAVRIEGQDSEIELNGATFTSNSNNFSINGLNITANGVTDPDEKISITTETDVDGIYDMVVDFFDEYNKLINEMDKLYNAKSSKGYEPLTDDEKEAMSDKEVEKWEAKIKDSLLRRDSTLQGVADSMKTAFLKGYEIDGKTYTLANFGIKTAGYFNAADNEKAAYHIDGNSKDSISSGNADKLKAAIASDPDTFVSFFTKLSSDVYDSLDKKMKSTSMKSAYNVYNDKKMKDDQKNYEKLIKQWEDKIETYETRYRKQFTAMEKAMAELNSQQSQLSGLLGM